MNRQQVSLATTDNNHTSMPLTVLWVTDEAIQATWDALPGALYYRCVVEQWTLEDTTQKREVLREYLLGTVVRLEHVSVGVFFGFTVHAVNEVGRILPIAYQQIWTGQSALHLEVTRRSMVTATVRWRPIPKAINYSIELKDQDTPWRPVFHDTTRETSEELEDLYPGCFYSFNVTAQACTPMGDVDLMSESVDFRAERTINELHQLHRIAVERHVDSTHDTLEVFFRTKLEEYFQDIEENCRNIMEVYTKDANEDQGSPINGVLKGLFFNVNVNKAHRRSPFGNQRLSIPADVMFQKLPNLYFTDFYCHRTQHYVTLVMTKDGSEADRFCREKLIPLDVATNPFVRYHRYGGDMSVADHDDIIEILCTENIDISDMIERHGARFTWVSWNGRPMNRGMPKNRRCTVCNI